MNTRAISITLVLVEGVLSKRKSSAQGNAKRRASHARGNVAGLTAGYHHHLSIGQHYHQHLKSGVPFVRGNLLGLSAGFQHFIYLQY